MRCPRCVAIAEPAVGSKSKKLLRAIEQILCTLCVPHPHLLAGMRSPACASISPIKRLQSKGYQASALDALSSALVSLPSVLPCLFPPSVRKPHPLKHRINVSSYCLFDPSALLPYFPVAISSSPHCSSPLNPPRRRHRLNGLSTSPASCLRRTT